MMLTRRALLRSGACALAAVAGPPRFLIRTAESAERKGKVLVAIFQRGAVDGLSMVPPHGDPAYVRARASIALAPPRRGDTATALDLDGFYALHPSLAPLKPLWEARTLAVVHACGSPDTTRSHFDVQDYSVELREREAILLRTMDLMNVIGVEFAFPTRTLQIEATTPATRSANAAMSPVPIS